MTHSPTGERRDRPVTRRRLLCGAAATAAGTAAASAFAGTATAADTITVSAALPADAPKYGHDDFVGLVVQVGNRVGDIDAAGVNTCPFVARETAADQGTYTSIDEDKIWGYNAEIVETENASGSGETTTLYSLAQNTSLDSEKRYIVNQQQRCDDYVQVQLELLTESGTGPEATTTTADGGDTTEATTPGFGVAATVGGFGTAALGALAAARGGDADE